MVLYVDSSPYVFAKTMRPWPKTVSSKDFLIFSSNLIQDYIRWFRVCHSRKEKMLNPNIEYNEALLIPQLFRGS